MKLHSGYVQLASGKVVLLPRPMTWMEIAHCRFGPLMPVVSAIGSVAAEALPYITTGLGVASSLQEGRVAEQEAKNAATVEEYNAKVKEQEAKQRVAAATVEQNRMAEAAARGMSELRVGQIGAGTNLEIWAKQQSEYELANLMRGYEGQIESGRALTEAAGYRMSAQAYKAQGKSAKQASYLKAGTKLFTGLYDAGVFKTKPSSTGYTSAGKATILRY